MMQGLRLADEADIPALEVLIRASARGLQAGDYSTAQIEAALGGVFGVDRQIIADGAYFVIEEPDPDTTGAGAFVACGGWSRRRTLFGAQAHPGRDDGALVPGVDAARIRAFFVRPDRARRGLAQRILAACEAAAGRAGFTALELGATLTGVAFYVRHGFVEAERYDTPLPGGGGLTIVRMTKPLPPPT